MRLGGNKYVYENNCPRCAKEHVRMHVCTRDAPGTQDICKGRVMRCAEIVPIRQGQRDAYISGGMYKNAWVFSRQRRVDAAQRVFWRKEGGDGRRGCKREVRRGVRSCDVIRDKKC